MWSPDRNVGEVDEAEARDDDREEAGGGDERPLGVDWGQERLARVAVDLRDHNEVEKVELLEELGRRRGRDLAVETAALGLRDEKGRDSFREALCRTRTDDPLLTILGSRQLVATDGNGFRLFQPLLRTGDLPLIARGCACWAPLMLHPCGRDRSLLRQRRT